MKTNLVCISLSIALISSCSTNDGDAFPNGVTVELIEAKAGGMGGSCPGSFVDFSLQVNNQTGQEHQIEIGRIFVLTERGSHMGGLSDGVLKDGNLSLTTGNNNQFEGTVSAGAQIQLKGYGEFAMGWADFADSPGTWHTEVEVLVDGNLKKLKGSPQTDTWPHTDCYLTDSGPTGGDAGY